MDREEIKDLIARKNKEIEDLKEQLQQENQQLKEQLGNRIVEFGYKETKYKSVLDEIREYITKDLDEPDPEEYREYKVDISWFNDLLQILDKAGSNEPR